MNNLVNNLYRNNSTIYKIVLFIITTVLIVYFFPKGGQFKYDFSQGKLWQYDNLYAPLDFSIQKTEDEIEKEKKLIKDQIKKYFVLNPKTKAKVLKDYTSKIGILSVSDSLSAKQIKNITLSGKKVIKKIYEFGFIDNDARSKLNSDNDIVLLRNGNSIKDLPFFKFTQARNILLMITDDFSSLKNSHGKSYAINLLLEIVVPNITYDNEYTEKELDEALKDISYTKGKVSKGELIILKGDIVEGRKFNILKSFEAVSKSQIWSKSNYNWIVLGYSILVSLALLMLLLFLNKYRKNIYDNNSLVTFIFFNIFFMVLLQTLVVKYNVDYLYVVPLSILPIVLKTFFDARLALFTHILTILLLGFIIPNSYEFIYLHIIAGIIAVLVVSNLYKRANLLMSVGLITLTYIITYFAFSVIKEGNANRINTDYFILFAANGLLSFLSIVFIYLYEKIFGLVSDIALLELSNTNSKLLRELNETAPGTFQHSMQVANLAEAAANEIGANSMLVRTGALYHDIGKMANPKYFTENQITGVNPHNDLSPKDSVRIILDHVINGIEIAKKYNLPDRIIDFIRTHHGTNTVYYFYKKEKDNNPDDIIDKKKFQYQGPIPFSKETAILMICDAAEAASKSLKAPTAQSIDELIDKIVEKQKNENQFINSDITFREIEKIKKVVKNKLMNIYHLRIEYPE